jgi:hypothetical protein
MELWSSRERPATSTHSFIQYRRWIFCSHDRNSEFLVSRRNREKRAESFSFMFRGFLSFVFFVLTCSNRDVEF